MKKLTGHYFNMVEIVLAITVIAVGLTSVLVLFPVGLNAHREAVTENNIADLAEYVITLIKADIALDNSNRDADGDYFHNLFYNNNSPQNKYKRDNIYDGIPDTASGTVPDMLNVRAPSGSSDKDYASVLKLQDNVYWVRQFGGVNTDDTSNVPYVTFSAVARIYVDDDNSASGNYLKDEFFPVEKNGRVIYKKYSDLSGSDVDLKRFVVPMVLELSYPADAAYDVRKKSYFRFEIINDNYDPQVDNNNRSN